MCLASRRAPPTLLEGRVKGFFHRVAAGAPYVAAPWNLNDLPGAAAAHGSMLRHPGDDVPGVTTRALGTTPRNQGPGFFCF